MDSNVSVVVFSASVARSSISGLLGDGVRELLRSELLSHPLSSDVLILDLGHEGEGDAARLGEIMHFAAASRDEPHRRFAALGILGDADRLSPEELVWLRVDAMWPSWRTEERARRSVAALRERADRRRKARADRKRYHDLCHRLRIGLYSATVEGDRFLWADEEAARIFGFENIGELFQSGCRPSARIANWSELVGRLKQREDGISSASLVGSGEERLRVLLALDVVKEGVATVSGFIHDFRPMLDEQEPLVQQRVADLLDELGYAYFSSRLDGTPLALSRNDRALLDDPPEDVHRTTRRQQWWADEERRKLWMKELEKKGRLVDYPVMAKTWKNRLRWIDVHARLVKDESSVPLRVEGIYRDATRRHFEERMARAFSMMGASNLGVHTAADDICHAAAFLFETSACALLFRDAKAKRVFAAHVWTQAEPWCHRSKGDGAGLSEVVFQEASFAWHPELEGKLFHVGPIPLEAAGLFGLGEDSSLLVLPLLPGEVEMGPEHAAKGVGRQAYLWLPLDRPLSFPLDVFSAEIEPFLRLCSRQLDQAANRDAFQLVHQILDLSASTTNLEQLKKTLEKARIALQERMAMEGCSIFHVGIEEQQAILRLATTSGLEGSHDASYSLGEGLSGLTAQRGETFVTFDKTSEPTFIGKHVEKTTHVGQTWMGVPMKDREGRTIGLIRCVNRTIGTTFRSITGFSLVDKHVVTEFGAACALLTELTLLQEERSRTLDRVVHEIRTPTIGIRNNVRFLVRAQAPPEKVAAKLGDLDLDATILLNLLQQVDVLRGRGKIQFVEGRRLTNVKDIVRKTFLQLIPEIRARDYAMANVFIDIHSLPELWLPKAAFAQVVFNLFMNALKYSAKDPSKFRIVVHSEIAPEAYKLHFKDWGIGVEESFRTKIFQEGVRASAARKRDARGLGLGLTICKTVLSTLGGDVVLETPREPTDFVMTLPKVLANKPSGAL